jgi:hypothetical protein
MRRTAALIPTVSLTSRTARRTDWRSPLGHQGYRSENRITVFQTLVHTLGSDTADVQIFLKAHNERNLAEYEGRMEIDADLLADLIRCTKKLEGAVGKLDLPAGE